MDSVISQLARYTSELTFEKLPEDVVRAASVRLVDTIGCAIGGLDCENVAIAQRMAPRVTEPSGSVAAAPARSIGSSERTTSLHAASLINGSMIRYLDFNDTYPGGHPSDMLGPLLSLADAVGASGEKLVTALVAGYDIFIRLASAAQLREKGWDQGYGIGLGCAAGASVILGLDYERTANALSLTSVANIPLRATRAGNLSMWKGVATPYAAVSALYCALLAAEGMTGPEAPIDGRHGLKELVSGPFDIKPFTDDPESFLTHMAWIKYWPVENHLQGAVWAGIELHDKVKPEDLASVEIFSYWAAWHETASETAKWDPRTRETADHSMPYVFAKAYETGALNLDAYEPAAYLAPEVRVVMNKVTAGLDDRIEAAFPETVILRAVATTHSGEVHEVEIVNPRGHQDNPVTDEETAEKFVRLLTPKYGAERSNDILKAWLEIASVERVSDAYDLLNLDG